MDNLQILKIAIRKRGKIDYVTIRSYSDNKTIRIPYQKSIQHTTPVEVALTWCYQHLINVVSYVDDKKHGTINTDSIDPLKKRVMDYSDIKQIIEERFSENYKLNPADYDTPKKALQYGLFWASDQWENINPIEAITYKKANVKEIDFKNIVMDRLDALQKEKEASE